MFSALSHFVFGASGLFSSHNQSDGIRTSTWKDKKLCFDLRPHDLELNRGEQLIGCFYPIEDVKGNQDELGLLKVTNLRLIWICVKNRRVNLSIGWRTITMTYEQNMKDALCGNSTSLFVLSKYESTKYEFVFARQAQQTDIWSGEANQESWTVMSQLRRLSQDEATLVDHLSPMYLDDPFDVVLKVWQAYKQTHLFRHCRSNINYLIGPQAAHQTSGEEVTSFRINDINLLSCEQLIEAFANIYQNESNVVRYSGSLLLTNIRLIWIDATIHLRNLSIPHIRIESLKLKSSDRIIVNTNEYLASSTQVEFQVQKTSPVAGGTPNKMAKVIFEQIQNIYTLYKSTPRFGPESCDDCVNFMSHLRPLKLYFDSIDKSMIKVLENFGPETNRANVLGINTKQTSADKSISESKLNSSNGDGSQSSDEDEVERTEKELDGYATKLINYLEERPLELDNDLIYSSDLGLAIEKPANGASLSSIWRINV